MNDRPSILVPAVMLLFAIPAAHAISSGAPERSSGAPGETTCTSCHGGTANSGPGKLQIEFPASATYKPGDKVRMRVIVDDPAARRWGFQLSAQAVGGSGGSFRPADSATQVLVDGISQWITHTSAGTRPNSKAPVAFEFDWTAPSSDVGQIVFYAAANAANGNGSSSGDSIYTSSLQIAPEAGSPGPSFQSDGVTDLSTGVVGIAAGAWVNLKGSDLASKSEYFSPVAGQPLPTRLAGVSVKVNEMPAALLYVGPARITFLVPAGTPEGDVPVVVENDGRASEPVFVRSTGVLPAIIGVPEPNADNPRLFASATTAGAGTALSLVTPRGWILGKPEVDSRAVRGAFPGEEIDLFAIGLGRTEGEFPTDRIFASNQPVTSVPTVLLGGAALTPSYSALVAPGVYVVRVTIPESQAAGEVPIFLEVNSVRSRDNVVLYVQLR